MTRKSLPLLVALAAALLAAPASSQAACPNQHSQPIFTEISLASFEASTFCLINQERAERGLAALSNNGKLAQAATGHSNSMRWNGFFSHESANGASFTDRIFDVGYMDNSEAWLVGENIAWGSFVVGTPRSMVTSWMNSPPHRKNILERKYRFAGVGIARGIPFPPQLPGSTSTMHYGSSLR